MRWVLVLGVVSALTLAHVAGSATSTQNVLWSGKPPVRRRVPCPGLAGPTSRTTGSSGHRPTCLREGGWGGWAVASLDKLVGRWMGRLVWWFPLSGVYDGRFSPDGSMLVLASFTCAYSDSHCEASRLSAATVETCACWGPHRSSAVDRQRVARLTSARSPPRASAR